jgi:hypothetical protein
MAGAPECDRRPGSRRAEAAGGLFVYLIGEHARQQRSKLLVWQRCELQQAGVQALELALGHRVKVDATNALLRTRALQPTQKNLGGTGIRDCALPQATLDFCVTRRFTDTSGCAARALGFAGVPSSRGVPPPRGFVRDVSDRPGRSLKVSSATREIRA